MRTAADFQNTDDVQDIIQFAKTVFTDFSALQSHWPRLAAAL
jgi:hypothetical protein